jgi:dipeptidyl aminopeptidase/acylaminoacyl peptidase
MKRLSLLMMVALLLVTTASSIAASFQGLGDLSGGQFRSSAQDVSADGSVVVGFSDSDSGTPAGRPKPLLAQWAPDGRTIYYKAQDAGGAASLWAVPAAGGEPRELVRFDDPVRASSRAEFATDGRRLYFTASEREGDIWRMELRAR